MADVAALEAEVKEYKLQLETVQSSLQADPSNQELLSLQSELEEFISLTEQSIAELRPQKKTPDHNNNRNAAVEYAQQSSTTGSSAAAASSSATTGYQQPQQQQQTYTPDQPITFTVNDTVLARWVSGDGAFYPAKITSVTGSKANPKYIVRFKEYNNVETLSAKDVKPISSATTSTASPSTESTSLKRKADSSSTDAIPSPPPLSGSVPPPPPTALGAGVAVTSPPPPPPTASTIISAAADINPALASAARNNKDGTTSTGRPERPAKAQKRARANKELEQGKAKWQEFANKNKFAKRGAAGKKDSMFRTGEGVNARVGFTGSGQQMRKDPARTKHIYQREEEDY
ncbi:Tudor domain protein [Ascosphaera apis ARSEF 7405]|uniref:Tudor domain protein n=1 Tax=Ascosphaera apis ARSEF 7405 TaxID=392613 RepID=A0A167X4E8_9EURO|nr:Tudor domain protein [Ascosphaera apis ARSEF 7405]